MTSLQQTAMGGGPATAKTADYVLVAADAGTTVAMDAAGATTITVNTGLFAAGDTVFIQNLGAGACTVTAGTATVATAGSLILPQNDAGILYFTSASAAIFYDYIQVGAASPLTTKGDLYTFGTSDTRLGVGPDSSILVADSAETTGLKWVTPTAAGANYSLLSTSTLTGAATITVSGLSGHDSLHILINNASAGSATFTMRFNGDTGSNYGWFGQGIQNKTAYTVDQFLTEATPTYTSLFLAITPNTDGFAGGVIVSGANTAGVKMLDSLGSAASINGAWGYNLRGRYTGTSVIDSVSLISSSGNFDNGEMFIYGSA
jgi:hypothetical protein